MKKLFILFSSLLALGLLVGAASAQTTSVSMTVVDPASTVWADGTVAYSFSPTPNTPGPYQWQGADLPSNYLTPTIVNLDSSGSATFNLPDNTTITPRNSAWTFVVCSNTSFQCSTVRVSVRGTSDDISSIINSNLSAITLPATSFPRAYSTSEITLNPVQGGLFYNANLKCISFWNGSTWTCLATSGSTAGLTGPYNLTNQIATFSNGLLESVGNPYSASISCSAAGVFETGNVSTNPNSCTFGYANGTTISASLTDGTHNVTLVTPYTSGSLPYVYSVNTTFTLNSTASSTQTATASNSISFLYREFAGVGSAGATSATAVGNNALLNTGSTLASVGLGTHSTFGPFTPSGQKIYVLGLNSSCTFTSGGFAFPMNAPKTFAFVNQYGQSINIYDYESVNLLSASFTLNGTC